MTPQEQMFVNNVAMQRNQAFDMIASLQTEIAIRDARISELMAPQMAPPIAPAASKSEESK